MQTTTTTTAAAAAAASGQQRQAPAAGTPLRQSRTMPQLNYTRADIQEQYLGTTRARRAAENMPPCERPQALGAGQAAQTRPKTLCGGGAKPTSYFEDESSGSSCDGLKRGAAAARERGRARADRKRRRRSQSGSRLLAACFNLPHQLGSILPSSASFGGGAPTDSGPSQRRSILAHLRLGGGPTGAPPKQRPLSSSQTEGNLQQIDGPSPTAAADQVAGRAKHVSFGGAPRPQQVARTAPAPAFPSAASAKRAPVAGDERVPTPPRAQPAHVAESAAAANNAQPPPPIYLVSQQVIASGVCQQQPLGRRQLVGGGAPFRVAPPPPPQTATPPGAVPLRALPTVPTRTQATQTEITAYHLMAAAAAAVTPLCPSSSSVGSSLAGPELLTSGTSGQPRDRQRRDSLPKAEGGGGESQRQEQTARRKSSAGHSKHVDLAPLEVGRTPATRSGAAASPQEGDEEENDGVANLDASLLLSSSNSSSAASLVGHDSALAETLKCDLRLEGGTAPRPSRQINDDDGGGSSDGGTTGRKGACRAAEPAQSIMSHRVEVEAAQIEAKRQPAAASQPQPQAQSNIELPSGFKDAAAAADATEPPSPPSLSEASSQTDSALADARIFERLGRALEPLAGNKHVGEGASKEGRAGPGPIAAIVGQRSESLEGAPSDEGSGGGGADDESDDGANGHNTLRRAAAAAAKRISAAVSVEAAPAGEQSGRPELAPAAQPAADYNADCSACDKQAAGQRSVEASAAAEPAAGSEPATPLGAATKLRALDGGQSADAASGAAPTPVGELRRDDFLFQVADSARVERVGEPAELSRPLTCTLSTRHHSYCSADHFERDAASALENSSSSDEGGGWPTGVAAASQSRLGGRAGRSPSTSSSASSSPSVCSAVVGPVAAAAAAPLSEREPSGRDGPLAAANEDTTAPLVEAAANGADRRPSRDLPVSLAAGGADQPPPRAQPPPPQPVKLSPSPPTTVSDLDQEEDLSTPSFVDSYKQRLELVRQLAETIAGELLGECLATRPLGFDCLPANGGAPPIGAPSSLQPHNRLLIDVPPTPTSGAGSHDTGQRKSSGSDSSTSTCSAASATKTAPTETSSSTTSASATTSYVCPSELERAQDCKPQRRTQRPRPPEKPAHLRALRNSAEPAQSGGARQLGEPSEDAATAAAAAAVAVAASSIAAAAVLHSAGSASGPAPELNARAAGEPQARTGSADAVAMAAHNASQDEPSGHMEVAAEPDEDDVPVGGGGQSADSSLSGEQETRAAPVAAGRQPPQRATSSSSSSSASCSSQPSQAERRVGCAEGGLDERRDDAAEHLATGGGSLELLSTVSEASGESSSAAGGATAVDASVRDQNLSGQAGGAGPAHVKQPTVAENLATDQDLAHSDYTLRSLVSETTEPPPSLSESNAAAQRRAVDCPYVHDAIATSAAQGQVLAGQQQAAATSGHFQKGRLSHDDTMEAIEEDVVEEEAARVPPEVGGHLDEHCSIAPPAGFSSTGSGGGGSESVSSGGRVSAPIEEEDENEGEGDEEEEDDDDDDNESSISVSQAHGVVVTRDVVGRSEARGKQAAQSNSAKSSPSSSGATPTRSRTSLSPTASSASSASASSSSSASASSSARQDAQPKESADRLSSNGGDGGDNDDDEGQQTPTKEEEKLTEQKVGAEDEAGQQVESEPLEVLVERQVSPQTTTCSSESGTQAILDHLSRHECHALGGGACDLDEPAPSLEQSRPIELAARRASWRRESGSRPRARPSAAELPQEVATCSAARASTSEQGGVASPPELSGTDTIKRRRVVAPSGGGCGPDGDGDAPDEDENPSSPSAGHSDGPHRKPPLKSTRAVAAAASSATQPQAEPTAAATRPSVSANSVDTSICSSCSCMEPIAAAAAACDEPKQHQKGQWMSQEEGTVFTENYWLSHWLYISEHEEAELWRRAIDMSGGASSQQSTSSEPPPPASDESIASLPKDMTETASTASERSFSSRFKSTTRKMIHRRASIEMYKRIMANKLRCEKRVEISRSNGEFGFRIHGSRPVVVSAIERGTAAETCGLQVGDLIYAINGTNILDMAHSDVVRLAHTADSAALVLDLVPTNDFLRMSKYSRSSNKWHVPVLAGFLMRLSASTAQPLLVELQAQIARATSAPGGAAPNLRQRAAKLAQVMRLAWRQRYFVLRSDNCLFWYKSPEDVEPQGGINLQGFSATLTNEFSEPNHVIRLVKYGGQPHYLGTNDTANIQTWVDAINRAATEANQNDPYMKRTLLLARAPPSSISEPDCAGWLHKFSHKRGGGAHWRPAYFVLKDACLYLYRADSPAGSSQSRELSADDQPQQPAAAAGGQARQQQQQAGAVYYLHGYRVRSKFIEHKRHTFELRPPNRKSIGPMFLMAPSEIDKKRWIAALEYSIDRWIEID